MSTIPPLRPTAPQEHIDGTYRALAKRPHPNRGGDPAAMRLLEEAYHALQREAST
jgi:curved DNA-binding protein CbpA